MVETIPTQTPVLTAEQKCPSCGAVIFPTDNFCPNCGLKIARGIDHIGIGKQLYIYVISLLAPPFGLIWTFKYIRQKNDSVKWVGIIAAILTIISLVVTVWFTIGFIQTTQNLINSSVNSGFNPNLNSNTGANSNLGL